MSKEFKKSFCLHKLTQLTSRYNIRSDEIALQSTRYFCMKTTNVYYNFTWG